MAGSEMRPGDVRIFRKGEALVLATGIWAKRQGKKIDGHAVLPREYHKHPEYEFSLTKTFPNDVNMHMINAILDKCVVEQADQCLPGAGDLLLFVDEALGIIKRGGQLLREGVPRPCRICGKGFYQPVLLRENPRKGPLGLRFWVLGTSDIGTVPAGPLACDYCGHVELFTAAPPSSR